MVTTMKTTTRLLLADIAMMWRQGLAISLLLACGVATWIMTTSTMRSMQISRERYYREYHFADVFLELTRAPEALAERFRDIPGVVRVDTRVVRHVILDLPTMPEPASCRLISLGDDPASALNGVYLRRGRFPGKYSETEVVASELFAKEHRLELGDHIDVLMAGKKERLTVVGIGLSPEWIYAVQPGLLVPDNRRYGILWMSRKAMDAAFNMEGAFNDAALSVLPGTSIREVVFQLDHLTERYGGRGAYDRSIQSSHSRVSDEMHQMRTMAYVTPAIFLIVAAFLFNIVLSRMVHQHKEQIATLRAFGFTSLEILRHYLEWILFWVVAGALPGIAVGYRLSFWMTNMYGRFFRFPEVAHEFAYREAILAIGLAALAAVLGGFSSLRRVIRLQPAVAMRPESPPHHRRLIVDRIGLQRFFSPLARLILGRLEANPVSSLLSIIGIAMGLGVVVLGSFMEDTIDFVIDQQYQRSQRQDLMITFYDPLNEEALYDLKHLRGVLRVEPFRAVAVRLRHGVRERRLGLMGLSEKPDLFRVLDAHQHPLQLPQENGLTITNKLAELLDVQAGDSLTVEVLEGERRHEQMLVASVFPNYTEPAAYLNRHSLHRWLRESEQVSGAFLEVDPLELDELFVQLKNAPHVATVLDNNAARRNFRKLVEESTRLMRTINATFAAIIAFGIIYNSALISLAERGRDVATLRVMGFTRREVAFVLLGEQAVFIFFAIPLGIAIGYAFAYMTTMALDTESHRFPLIVHRDTFAYATVVILATAATSSFIVRRMLDRIDLIAVLKVRE